MCARFSEGALHRAENVLVAEGRRAGQLTGAGVTDRLCCQRSIAERPLIFSRVVLRAFGWWDSAAVELAGEEVRVDDSRGPLAPVSASPPNSRRHHCVYSRYREHFVQRQPASRPAASPKSFVAREIQPYLPYTALLLTTLALAFSECIKPTSGQTPKKFRR